MELTENTNSPSKLPKCANENAVEPSWMMVQAQGDMDVPSEPLGDFHWSMRINNFVWGAEGLLRGTSAFPLDSGVGEAPRR